LPKEQQNGLCFAASLGRLRIRKGTGPGGEAVPGPGFVLGVMMMGAGVMRTWVVSAGVVSAGVMRTVAMMLVGSKGRAGKHHQEERGGKNLLHGTNLTRCSPRR